MTPFGPPIDPNLLLRRKKALRRELLQRDLVEKRIAILGGSTTAELQDMLELFLLNSGFKPSFFESDYNRYFEDLAFPSKALRDFRPELIYLHVSNLNITRYPATSDGDAEVELLLEEQIGKFRTLWDRADQDYGCPVIQNNFEMPHSRELGNLDCYLLQGRTRFVAELNIRLSAEARLRKQLYLNDLHYLSAWYGLERWYDLSAWYAYKYAMNIEAIPYIAQSISAIINSIFGKAKKCIVLDLDNTLWGGVIGDDGVAGLQLGPETATGEAFVDFQKYLKRLKDRGIILAAASKNEENQLKEGLAHPASILKPDDFSASQVNWGNKPENLRAIAKTLNIDIGSLVFVDDNPVERELVRAQEPSVVTPEMGSDVSDFIGIIDKSGLFEPVSISREDLRRASLYADNTRRATHEAKFEDYESFLQSLEMTAEIKPLNQTFAERALQLCNKTNQFNLTTPRLTQSQLDAMMAHPDVITIYGRLTDKFGDNGLVSLMSADIKKDELQITLWLMSCRVFKRGLEAAMLDEMVAQAKTRGMTSIGARYLPTAKNKIVSGLLPELGFEQCTTSDDGASNYRLSLESGYKNRNSIIRVNHGI